MTTPCTCEQMREYCCALASKYVSKHSCTASVDRSLMHWQLPTSATCLKRTGSSSEWHGANGDVVLLRIDV